MLFYVIILGFGVLAGAIINILINQKNLVYTVIGSIVILLTGAFACFVLYYPFYFDSFRSLITALIIAAVFFIVIYVALRLIVNTVVPHHEPLTQPNSDSRSQLSKQPAHVRSADNGRISRVKTKTIKNVEVTRINKAVIQSVKTAGLTAPKAPSPDNISSMRIANNFLAEQIEPVRATVAPAAISNEELIARLPEPAAVQTDEIRVNSAQSLPVQISKTTVDIPLDQVAAVVAEQSVHEFEAFAVQMDEEAVGSEEMPAQEPQSTIILTDSEDADSVEIPIQEPAIVVLTDAEAVGSLEMPVQEPKATVVQSDEEAVDSVVMPVQELEPATILTDAEAAASVVIPVSEPDAVTVQRDAETAHASELSDQPEALAVQSDEEAVDSVEIPVSQPDAAAIQRDAETAHASELSDQPEAAAVQSDEEAVDSVKIPVQELEAAELPDHEPETAAEMQLDEDEDVSNSVQETSVQPSEVSTPEKPVSVTDKYSILLEKAMELIDDGKYIYALQLLKVCLSGPSSFTQQKQADIMALECLILSEQYDQAQKKWLEVLNKMYILESTDKIRLKQLLSLLNSRNKRVS